MDVARPPRSDDQPQSMSVKMDSSKTTIVAIGASAGGVEALEQLFSPMPEKLGVAFVVIQHLAPDFESLMPEILSRKTDITVSKIENGIKVEPDHVYVIPNGKVAQIKNGHFVTRVLDKQLHPHPIDYFFESLAEHSGENAIGVILSGTGTDGAAGVSRLHDQGGIVIVQSEDSCKFNGMPRAAISTGVVDAIVPVGEIHETIQQFAETLDDEGRPSRSLFTELMDAEKKIIQLLHLRFGIDFDQYNQGMVGRRIARRMMMSKQAEIGDFLRYLENDPVALADLYHDLLIGVTEFFRDPQAFHELQQLILPELIESAKETGKLRVWVVPCASGEEAYSIAILIDELLTQRNLSIDVKIFATDVNKQCVDFAGKAVFPENRMGNVSRSRLNEYFIEQDSGYRIIPRIRKQVVFAKHDLLKDAPFTKLDLVCCRNLLIYFKPEAKKKALSLFSFALRESGILFLGPSETTTELESVFAVVDPMWQIHRAIEPVRFSQVGLAIGTPSSAALGDPSTENSRISQLLPAYDLLLAEYIPAGMLINERNQLLHVFGRAHDYIQFKSGRPTENVLDLLPMPLSVAIANALKQVKIESKPVVHRGLEFEHEGEVKNFVVSVKPLNLQPAGQHLVTIEEFNSASIESIDNAVVQSDGETISLLERELSETRGSLHDTILKLKSTNEDMQSTNEEIIAANEELQSTNEELQSVNEELYTVNTEHQRKIAELTQLTDDMDNLLDSLHVDTIFLDNELRVRKYTFGIASTFKLLPHDIGREFSSFTHGLLFDDMIGQIQKVLINNEPFESDVQDTNGNWYLMRLLPYNANGKIEGVLLTLIEISDIKETEQRLGELSEIVQSSDDAIFRLSVDGEIRTWNHGASEMFMRGPESVVGKGVGILGFDKPSEVAVSDKVEKFTLEQSVDHIELQAVRRNGESFDVAATISPIYKPSQKLDGASVVLRDITAQNDARKQIQEQVRLRDHFLAVLSHELRNPTAAIVNASALLSRDDVGDDQKAKANEVIFRHSQQLAKMMDDLLHVARVTHNKINLEPSPVNLNAAANQVVECIEGRVQEKGQTLKLDLPDEPLMVLADATRLIQAQTNLLVNASKYTQSGGEIVYTVRQQGDEVVIEVRDNGEGMAEELVARIFDVFVQADQTLDRSSGGMGLGLPLVKMIAEAHGGSITATSAGIGSGSVFQLRLPHDSTANVDRPLIEDPDIKNASQLAGKRILLVEDNQGAREMLANYLSLEEMNVCTAKNGVEGIEKFRSFSPDLCIVDIGLPDLNGFEVAAKIRKYSDCVALVALTGYGQSTDRLKADEAGFDLHLVKPISPENIISQIGTLLTND